VFRRDDLLQRYEAWSGCASGEQLLGGHATSQHRRPPNKHMRFITTTYPPPHTHTMCGGARSAYYLDGSVFWDVCKPSWQLEGTIEL
jgi:hypothetical protein